MVQIKVDSKSHDDVPCPWYKQRKLWCSLTVFLVVVCQQAIVHANQWAEDGPEQPTTLPLTSSLEFKQHSSSSSKHSSSSIRSSSSKHLSSSKHSSSSKQQSLDDTKSTSVHVSGGPSFGFYLFGDIPYAEWEEGMLRDQIDRLSKTRLNHTLFTVHVGDLQKTQRSLCKEDYYRKMQQLLRRGPLPTYVLAGDNDWYGEFDLTETIRIANSHLQCFCCLVCPIAHTHFYFHAQCRLSQTQGSL